MPSKSGVVGIRIYFHGDALQTFSSFAFPACKKVQFGGKLIVQSYTKLVKYWCFGFPDFVASPTHQTKATIFDKSVMGLNNQLPSELDLYILSSLVILCLVLFHVSSVKWTPINYTDMAIKGMFDRYCFYNSPLSKLRLEQRLETGETAVMAA